MKVSPESALDDIAVTNVKEEKGEEGSSDLEGASVFFIELAVKKEESNSDISEVEASNEVNVGLETKLEPLTPVITIKKENLPVVTIKENLPDGDDDEDKSDCII